VGDIDFWMDFVVGNSNKLQKLGLEGKISWPFNVFTLPNLKKFNFENVKNENVFTLVATTQVMLMKMIRTKTCLIFWSKL
jgi:hypothetical protein